MRLDEPPELEHGHLHADISACGVIESLDRIADYRRTYFFPSAVHGRRSKIYRAVKGLATTRRIYFPVRAVVADYGRDRLLDLLVSGDIGSIRLGWQVSLVAQSGSRQ